MDYKEQAELNKALAAEWNKCSCIYKIGGMKPKEFLLLNATAITDLLARAEAAEARAEKAEENFSKSVDALKHEREFAAKEREKRENAEKHLKALSAFALGSPIMISGQREVISFCGIPVEDAMQRVLDYPQLKKRAENAEKTLAELLEKNAKIQANIDDTVCVNVVPSNLYSEHDFYFEMSVKGFCKQCVFVFEDKNYSIEELCKVISKTFTDMLREYEAKSESGEK